MIIGAAFLEKCVAVVEHELALLLYGYGPACCIARRGVCGHKGCEWGTKRLVAVEGNAREEKRLKRGIIRCWLANKVRHDIIHQQHLNLHCKADDKKHHHMRIWTARIINRKRIDAALKRSVLVSFVALANWLIPVIAKRHVVSTIPVWNSSHHHPEHADTSTFSAILAFTKAAPRAIHINRVNCQLRTTARAMGVLDEPLFRW